MTEKTLQPIKQKDVEFYGDALTAVLAENEQVYVSVRHMCDALGLNVQGQTRRIKRHTILTKGFMVAKMSTIKGDRPANWLRVDLVPLWLSGISTKSVKTDARDKLEHFQQEAATVLWKAFQEGQLTVDPSFTDLLAQDSPEAVAYKMIQGMLQLARNQVIMRGQLQEHEQRLETIEAQLGDTGRYVTLDQASQISQAVKAIAMIMSKQSKSNQYGAVYGEMYRRFGITSYKQLPAARFDECMSWLTVWHTNLSDEAF